MSDDLSYKIHYSDDSKTPIAIAPNTRNYDTPLVLFGRGATDWGIDFNTNLVRMLENFCNDYLPGYAGQVLEGQLWYDSYNKQLNLCTKSTKDDELNRTAATLEWTPLTNIPSPELFGIVTNSSLDLALADYIPLTGNAIVMTGSLLVSSVDEMSDPLSVATKKYVDTLVCACANSSDTLLDSYVSVSGAETSTTITLVDNTAKTNYAASKKYVDLKRKITNSSALDLTVTNATSFITGLEMSSTSELSVKYVSYSGYIIIPGTTTAGNITCECTLPYTLATGYCVTVSSSVSNGNDVAGTTNTGSAGDAYVELTSTTMFKIKCTAKTSDMTVYVSVNGIKGTANNPIVGNLFFDGNAEVGQTLTAAFNGVSDTDGLSQAPTYQWYRGTTAIPSATANTYLVVQADVGAYIGCTATYVDNGGHIETLSATIGPVT